MVSIEIKSETSSIHSASFFFETENTAICVINKQANNRNCQRSI